MDCLYCATQIPSTRPKRTKYCKDECRLRAFRKRKKDNAAPPRSGDETQPNGHAAGPADPPGHHRPHSALASTSERKARRIPLDLQILQQAPPGAWAYRLVLPRFGGQPSRVVPAQDASGHQRAWHLAPFEPPDDLELQDGAVYRILWLNEHGEKLAPRHGSHLPALRFFLGLPDPDLLTVRDEFACLLYSLDYPERRAEFEQEISDKRWVRQQRHDQEQQQRERVERETRKQQEVAAQRAEAQRQAEREQAVRQQAEANALAQKLATAEQKIAELRSEAEDKQSRRDLWLSILAIVLPALGLGATLLLTRRSGGSRKAVRQALKAIKRKTKTQGPAAQGGDPTRLAGPGPKHPHSSERAGPVGPVDAALAWLSEDDSRQEALLYLCQLLNPEPAERPTSPPAAWLALSKEEQTLLRTLLQGLSRHKQVRDVLTSMWRTRTSVAPDSGAPAAPQPSTATAPLTPVPEPVIPEMPATRNEDTASLVLSEQEALELRQLSRAPDVAAAVLHEIIQTFANSEPPLPGGAAAAARLSEAQRQKVREIVAAPAKV